MTREEQFKRAHLYVRQAIERLTAVEPQITLGADATGAWVSLRRNLESAQADLEAALAVAPPTP